MARTWITKVNNVDTVDAAHVNDLQTYKLDKEDFPITEPAPVLCIGDSMTADPTYPNRLQALLGAGFTVINIGEAGETAAQVKFRFVRQVVTAGDTEYVVILCGVNSVIADATAISIEADLQAMYTAAHSIGIKVIAVTILPFKNYVGWTAPRQVVLDAVNAWITGTAINVDYIYDAYPAFESPADTLSAAYDSGDGLHPNAGGYIILGNGIFAAAAWAATSYARELQVSGVTMRINQDVSSTGSPLFIRVNGLPFFADQSTRNVGVGQLALNALTTGVDSTCFGHVAGAYTTTGSITAVGSGAGWKNVDGNVTAVGYSAAGANISAIITAIGYQAAFCNTIGITTAVGYQAAFWNVDGRATCVGHTAGRANTAGDITAVGHGAGSSNETGSLTAVGFLAGASSVGANVVCIGHQAGASNVSGGLTAVGYQAGKVSTGDSVFVGYDAGVATTSGICTIVGYAAGLANTTGNMTAIGYAAGLLNEDGTLTVVGYHAGHSNTHGSMTAIGEQAGYLSVAGTGNIFVGSSAGYYETGSDKLFIDDRPRASEADGRIKALIYGGMDNTTAAQWLTTNANLGIGTSTFGTNADFVCGMKTGTAPTTSPADSFQMYSKDSGGVGGKAGPHFRCEDGTVIDLQTIGAGSTHAFLSATHSDTVPAAPVKGDIIYADATPNWTKLAKGAATDYLKGGDAPAWTALNQAAVAGLTTGDSPVFVTIKCSGLTDGYAPYHVADATGLGNSSIFYDGTNIGIGTILPLGTLHIYPGATHDSIALHISEPGYSATYGVRFRANSDSGIYAWYAWTNSVQAGAPMVAMNRSNNRVGINDASPAFPLDVDGVINSSTAVYVADTKVVGVRVIDDRCDDAINSGDATTDGVIDALRDAMITHGLIAAA
jgi:lysophospholipase L1-like esterase